MGVEADVEADAEADAEVGVEGTSLGGGRWGAHTGLPGLFMNDANDVPFCFGSRGGDRGSGVLVST